MSDTWKQYADAAAVDLRAALASESAAALGHLRDAVASINDAIGELESAEAPEE